jgi:hypothetical protein
VFRLGMTWRLWGDYKVVGVGDFNRDGTSNLFWRNDSSNHKVTWHDPGAYGVDHTFIL